MRRVEFLAWVSAFVVGLAVYNTVFNNAYVYGATVADSAMFETMMWRGGWTLRMAPVFEGRSFFHTHFSPFLLLPNALSYAYPGSRIGFYALVYGAGWGFTALVVFRVLRQAGAWSSASFAGVLAVMCGQPLFNGSWEPHMEQFAPGLALLLVLAWQRHDYRAALAWLFVLGLIREDFALLFALPVVLMGLVQVGGLRNVNRGLARRRLGWVSVVAVSAFVYVALAFALQKTFFTGGSVISATYFDFERPLAHLSESVLLARAAEIGQYRTGLWLPLCILAMAALMRRDWLLLVGAVCFLPALTVLFLAKLEMNGTIASYQAFMLVLCLLWPALVAVGRPIRLRRFYLVLQAITLAAGLVFIAVKPDTIVAMRDRWGFHHLAYRQADFEVFRRSLAGLHAAGPLRASHGVVSLYPYDFEPWFLSMVADMPEGELHSLKTLIWFDGDRDQEKVAQILRSGVFDTKSILGTKLRVSRRADVASVASVTVGR